MSDATRTIPASPVNPGPAVDAGPGNAGPAVPGRRRIRTGHERTNWPATALLIVCTLGVLIPLYVTISMAFKTTGQAVDGNAFSLPSPLTFDSFAQAWTLTNFPRGFEGKKNVFQVSDVARSKPIAPTAINSTLSVKRESNSANATVIAGLRMNLTGSKPSVGASFHPPPTATIKPLANPTSATVRTSGRPVRWRRSAC